MVEDAPHPLVAPPPGGLCWRRSERRRYGRAAEAHAELVVLHGLTGRARYLIDGRVFELAPGSLLWAFAGQSHVLLSDEPDFDMWVFVISHRVLPPGKRDRPDRPPLRIADVAGDVAPRIVAHDATEELDAIAAAIVALGDPEARAAGLRWWLIRAWHHWRAAPDGAFVAVHPAVERAARLIRDDPTQTIAEVAAAAGLSAGRLARLFKAQTGKRIVAYRTEQKLSAVESAMRIDPRGNLLTAALNAGFGSYSQFYRAFEAHHGIGPRGYFQALANPGR